MARGIGPETDGWLDERTPNRVKPLHCAAAEWEPETVPAIWIAWAEAVLDGAPIPDNVSGAEVRLGTRHLGAVR